MPLIPRNDNSLLTPEFCLLMGVTFLAFCNISLFYGLNDYLEARHIPSFWRGVLLGLEPCTALLVRPLISPFLSVRNCLHVVAASLLILMTALLSYSAADTLLALAGVRVIHGLGFVLLVSAVAVLLVAFLPPNRVGQGFGIFAIASLLPYAVLPPVVERLLLLVGSEPRVYALFAPALIPALLVLPYLHRRLRRMDLDGAAAHRRPTFADITADLRSPGIGRLLAANGLLFTATTVVFFFMKDRLMALGMHNVGLFFSISTAATIAVRVFCGRLMDSVNRAIMLAVTLTALAGVMVLFSVTGTVGPLYALAGLYGLCIGFAMPQLNAAMFVISPAHLRGLNTNLMLFTMDAGYVFGPLLAGGLLNAGVPSASLFACFAVGPLLGALLTLRLAGLMRRHAPDRTRADG
ncbi:MFS transporter [Pseudodesulfovibrio cashew]|uniref:MFS transporter n=1 Tax=Pseudodesulfovibrio cashew TaxID=2678688 RepID=A0A6I6JP90_9BACT|nr:MFS transporter [Pseudodesulfovibrio cashew]QGY41863.1 MFS transporter [Pseudodesulfovibrio cashew]